jgi:excisionase family DNA binding protein
MVTLALTNEEVADGYCTIRDVQRYFSVSRQTVYTWMRNKDLSYLKLGKCLRFHRKSLKDLAKRCVVGG